MIPLALTVLASHATFWAIVAGFAFVALVMCYVALVLPEAPWERDYLDGRER